MNDTWQSYQRYLGGLTLFRSGRSDDALECFRQAADGDPASAHPWNGRGFVMGAAGRYPEALDAYQRAIELDPASAHAWNGSAYILTAQGRYPEALSAYRRAIELDRGFAYPWNGVANVLAATGKYSEALDAYRSAVELDPRFAHPWYGKAMVLRTQPDLEAAAGHTARQCLCRAIHLFRTWNQEFPAPMPLLVKLAHELDLPLLAHELLHAAETESPLSAEIEARGSPPLEALSLLASLPGPSDIERALRQGMICYLHGNPLRAFEHFDAVDSADDTHLVGQYYLIASLRAYLEPADREIAFAADQARKALRRRPSGATPETRYYANLILRLAGGQDAAAAPVGAPENN